jgi:hypothetical protein
LDNETLNLASTVLQLPIWQFPDKSLPTYLLSHPDTLEQLFSFLEFPSLSHVIHPLLRACVRSREFTRFAFEAGIVAVFLETFCTSDATLLTPAFATFWDLMTTHMDISLAFLEKHWDTVMTQFQLLLTSPNYLLQSDVLEFLNKFLLLDSCRSLLLEYFREVENLHSLLKLICEPRKKIRLSAYWLLRLFVLNPRPAPEIVSCLSRNRVKLIRALRRLPIRKVDESMTMEWTQVISILESLPES